MLNFQIFRVCQVFNPEEFLHLMHPILCKIDGFFLFVYDKISGFLDFFTHDRSHFRHLTAAFTSNHLTGQDITYAIKFRGFSALT